MNQTHLLAIYDLARINGDYISDASTLAGNPSAISCPGGASLKTKRFKYFNNFLKALLKKTSVIRFFGCSRWKIL
jgi:hypothetical protein